MNEIDAVRLNFSPESMAVLNGVLAIIMFSIALDIRLSDFRRLIAAPRPALTGIASQFLALPALTFLLVVWLEPTPSMALGMILVAACPGGNISNFITHRAGGNAALSVSLTAFATMGAIFLTPLNIAFWGGLYGPTREILRTVSIDPLSVAFTVVAILILPLILGITLNARAPGWAAQVRKPLQWISMAIFVAFVALAILGNWTLFLAYAGAVAGLVILHNAVAFGAGYGLATLLRLSDYDRRAVTIETGIQNSGLGLVLIFGFFDGLGGMATIAAFWGIWHAIAGIALAGVLARRPAMGRRISGEAAE